MYARSKAFTGVWVACPFICLTFMTPARRFDSIQPALHLITPMQLLEYSLVNAQENLFLGSARYSVSVSQARRGRLASVSHSLSLQFYSTRQFAVAQIHREGNKERMQHFLQQAGR